MPLTSRLVAGATEIPTWIIATVSAPVEAEQALVERGAEVLRVGADPAGRPTLTDAMRLLGTRGLTRLFCEGGPELAEALALAGLLDEVCLVTSSVDIRWRRTSPAPRTVCHARRTARVGRGGRRRRPFRLLRETLMFTGIVTDVGRIAAVSSGERLRRIRIESAYRPETIALGASIACGGPCLTVVAAGGRGEGCWFEVDAAAETIARTNVSEWKVGTRVNLERSLSIGDELGGHIVTGHVDGLATILAREAVTPGEDPWGATARFEIEAPRALSRFIAEKGSVCLDGTSLTVNSVEGRRVLRPHHPPYAGSHDLGGPHCR